MKIFSTDEDWSTLRIEIIEIARNGFVVSHESLPAGTVDTACIWPLADSNADRLADVLQRFALLDVDLWRSDPNIKR